MEEVIDRNYIDLRIKEVMAEKGVTGLELASRLGKHSQYVYNIINGGKAATLGSLVSVAKALGVPFRDLFGPGTQAEEAPAERSEGTTSATIAMQCPHCKQEINVRLELSRQS